MKKATGQVICILVIIAGIALFIYPDVRSWLLQKDTESYIEEFDQTYAQDADKTDDTLPGLRQLITEYNSKIFEEGQSGFTDAWSFEQSPVPMDGLEDGRFGYIEIPAMNVTLPLYTGASMENLSKGAAVLGETSYPVGGENTNSVIAAHRGYKGIPFFRDIELLTPGDAVYITNPWDTIAYRVESIDIIEAYDTDAVMIQEGRDMITLITCHPYRSHGIYRYIVYCVRDDSLLDTRNTESANDASGENIAASDGNIYESSSEDIIREGILRKTGLAVIIVILVLSIIRMVRNRK